MNQRIHSKFMIVAGSGEKKKFYFNNKIGRKNEND